MTPAPVPTGAPGSRRPGISVRSAGLLAWVPPARAFRAGGGLAHLQVAVGLAATAVLTLLYVLYAVTQAEARFLALATATAGAAATAGTLVERHLARRATAADADAEADDAVAAAREARERRAAARALAAADPGLARDLRVGRPDLAAAYDDGGLVDLNTAPADVLAEALDLDPEETARVVALRGRLGRFRSPDDLVALAGLPQHRLDRVADRVVVLP